jgi:hypothetical protein
LRWAFCRGLRDHQPEQLLSANYCAVCAVARQNRKSARPQNTPPIKPITRNCGHTTLNPAPRTKCVGGDADAQELRHALRRRVAVRQDRHWSRNHRLEQAELRHRTRNGAEKYSDRGGEEQIDGDPVRNSRIEPWTGMSSSAWIVETATATRMTEPLAKTFDIAISNGDDSEKD